MKRYKESFKLKEAKKIINKTQLKKDFTDAIDENHKLENFVSHDYHCLMLPLNDDFVRTNMKFLQKNIKLQDIYNDKTNNFGLESNYHITILYGLKNEKDYAAIKKYFNEQPEIKVLIGDLSLFENQDKPYDVLKFNIISKDLVRHNTYIKENFDCNITFSNYQPHLTVAYLKKGQGKKYLNFDSDLTDEVFTESEIVFSFADGRKLIIDLEG